MGYDLICKQLSKLEECLYTASSSYLSTLQSASGMIPGMFASAALRAESEAGAFNALLWAVEFDSAIDIALDYHNSTSKIVKEVRHLKKAARAFSLLDRLADAGYNLGLSTEERTNQRKASMLKYIADFAGMDSEGMTIENAHLCIADHYAGKLAAIQKEMDQKKDKAQIALYNLSELLEPAR